MREEALCGSLTWAKEKGGARRKLEGGNGSTYIWCLQERGECQNLIPLERKVFFLGCCEKAVCSVHVEYFVGAELLFCWCPDCGPPTGGQAPA